MKYIDLIFDENGEMTSEGFGFKGKECDAKMKEFADALGVVTNRTNKPEYKQAIAAKSKQKT
jgi:hypothetical protein